jgi:hypothetical protein
LLCALLLVCLVGSTFKAEVQASQLSDPPESNSVGQQAKGDQVTLPTGFQIVSSTHTSLVLEIQAPSYNIETVLSEDKSCQSLKADGYFQTSLPGEPGLLSAGVMIGIPLNTTPSYTIQSIETVDLPGQIHLCPVATPVIQRDQIGLADYQGDVLTENPLVYSQAAFLPTQPVELVTSGMIRSQHVARLSFTPFLYSPIRDELRLIRHIKLEIHLGKDDFVSTASLPVDEGPFETLLQKILINYDQARSWRSPRQPEPSVPTVTRPSAPLDQPAYKIQVNQDGLYQVTYAALQSVGVPVDSLDPRTFRLLNQGVETPVFVFGEEDGVLNSEDYLLFYGQKIVTKYTNTNIYWLSWGGVNGLRMSMQDGTAQGAASPVSFKTTQHLEENHEYSSNKPSGLQNDHWYWSLINAYKTPASASITFQLQNLATGSMIASLRGLIKGSYATPQHHTRISLNGHLIDDQTWPSTSDHSFSIDFPQSYLIEGTNTITVECPLDGGITIDQVLVNWFEIDFYHTYTSENNLLAFGGDQPGLWEFQVGGFSSNTIDVLDITNPSAPVRIIGGSILPNGSLYQVNFDQQVSGVHLYLSLSPSRWLTPVAITQDVSSNLKDPTNGADYIIITHSDFLAAIQPLATYRASQGLRVKIVNVQDVYDEFNGGVFDPQAIQNFLAYAYSYWIAPAPSYVLLVGDGHYDFKDNYGDSGPNYVPPFLGEFDPWIGETAADNRYVTVSGNDILPDMSIGRLPANSASETTAMVNKILSYEQNPSQGDWNNHLTFVADNADAGGDFPGLSDNIADHYLPPTYLAEKIYYGFTPFTSVPETQAAILNAVNQGRLIVSFVGHGSSQFWAAENLFSVSSIASLTNTEKYPFFAPMTCSEGYFIFPIAQGFNYPSLAESLVRASGKGAIASFSPAGFGLASGHDLLAQGLYKAFFSDGTTQFGRATTFAKYYLDANGPGYLDLIDTYNLFGDPASRLKMPPTTVLIFFTGKAQPGTILLDWETANELWMVGFNLYRSETYGGLKQKLNSDLINAINPGQMQGTSYQYDDSVDPGTNYFYWIELVQVDGSDLIGPISVSAPFWINLPLVIR